MVTLPHHRPQQVFTVQWPRNWVRFRRCTHSISKGNWVLRSIFDDQKCGYWFEDMKMELGTWNGIVMKTKTLGWRGFVKAIGFWAAVAPVLADETCMSPYMPKITGQEEFV